MVGSEPSFKMKNGAPGVVKLRILHHLRNAPDPIARVTLIKSYHTTSKNDPSLIQAKKIMSLKQALGVKNISLV